METIVVVKDGVTVFSARATDKLYQKVFEFAKGLGGTVSTTKSNQKETAEKPKSFTQDSGLSGK